MKNILLITILLVLSSCARYPWVDLNDCKDRVENLAKCREVK